MTEFIQNYGLVGESDFVILQRLASYADCPSHTGPQSLNLFLAARNVSGAVQELFAAPEHAGFLGRVRGLTESLGQHATEDSGRNLQRELVAILRQYARECAGDG